MAPHGQPTPNAYLGGKAGGRKALAWRRDKRGWGGGPAGMPVRVGRGARGRRPAPRAPRPWARFAPRAPRPLAPRASPGSQLPGRPAPPFLSGPHPTPCSHLLLTA
jgi:hypothetical protein